MPGQPRAQFQVSRAPHANTSRSTSACRAGTASESGSALAQYSPITGGTTLQYASYMLEFASAMLAPNTTKVARRSATKTVSSGESLPSRTPVATAAPSAAV